MKYFTKYLPVEGGFQRSVKDNNGIPVDFEQEVKLFLCSNDIQVNDKVVYSDGSGNEICTDIIADKKAGLIKVIGELSPEAIWVKEGDIFTEEQVQHRAYYHALTDRQEDWHEVPEALDWGSYPTCYFIQCPTCKSFH